MQMEITVANSTLQVRFDGDMCSSGTVVRQADGIEASFNSPDCLLHLLEGLLGRRAWGACRDQVLALIPCLRASL